jgi:hypothetical protein
MVRKSFLKKIAIPFATVSTSMLMFTFHQAKAASLSDILLQKKGALTHDYSGSTHTALFHNLEVITGYILKGIDYLFNLPNGLPQMSADLLTNIYHFLSKIVLQTPLFIFNNPYLKNTSLTFALISITIVTLLTVYEAIMQMLNKKHTNFKTILKRYFLVAGISGFMPFAFETGFDYLNKLSDAIAKIGAINGGDVNGMISSSSLGLFDTLIVCLFDITAIALLIPICLQAGRRWWDLLCLAAISPLALSAWVFDRHQHYFNLWWNRVKALSLVQIVYSVFILLMGILIFTTQSIQGGFFTLIIKIVLVLGGLWRLSNPPRFVTAMTDNKSDILDMYDEGKDTFKTVLNTITFRNFRPVKFLKNKLKKK